MQQLLPLGPLAGDNPEHGRIGRAPDHAAGTGSRLWALPLPPVNGASDVFLAHYDEHNKPQWAIKVIPPGLHNACVQ